MNAHAHPQRTRKHLLQACLGLLVVTASLAAFSLLVGEFGEFEIKVMLSSVSISIGCVCTMAWVAVAAKTRYASLGATGFVLNATTLAFVIAGIWLEVDSETFWQCIASLVVFCIASAHASLLMVPRLPVGGRWLQPVAVALIALLALSINSIIWAQNGSEETLRLVGVVGIGVVLMTLVIPIVSRFATGNDRGIRQGAGSPERLVLVAVEDELYRDAAGARFRVERLTLP